MELGHQKTHWKQNNCVEAALCHIGSYYGFFFSSGLFVLFHPPTTTTTTATPPPPPSLSKATVYVISLATKACDQSFIIYDAANGPEPIKTDIFALHKVLAGRPDNGPINIAVLHADRPPGEEVNLTTGFTIGDSRRRRRRDHVPLQQ